MKTRLSCNSCVVNTLYSQVLDQPEAIRARLIENEPTAQPEAVDYVMSGLRFAAMKIREGRQVCKGWGSAALPFKLVVAYVLDKGTEPLPPVFVDRAKAVTCDNPALNNPAVTPVFQETGARHIQKTYDAYLAEIAVPEDLDG